MGKASRKVKRTLAIGLMVIAAMVLSLIAIYFLALPTFTIVSDRAFSTVLPKAELRRLGLSLASNGIRLKVDTFKDESFESPESFSNRLGKVKGRWVLLSPVLSAYSVNNAIDVSEMLSDSVAIAMYAYPDTGLFDCTLVSDERSGWVKAASSVASEMAVTARNTALVYEVDSIAYRNDIVACFSPGWLSVFEDDGQSRLFVSSTMAELDRQNIVIALCPYESKLYDFFSSPGTVNWVVDYRFAATVPKSQLYGIVIPAFSDAFGEALHCEKGQSSTVKLEYRYEKL